MELGVTLLFYFEFVYYSNIEISLKWLGKLFKSNLLYNNSIKPLFYSVLTFNTNAKVLNNFPENCVCIKLKMEVKFQTVVVHLLKTITFIWVLLISAKTSKFSTLSFSIVKVDCIVLKLSGCEGSTSFIPSSLSFTISLFRS